MLRLEGKGLTEMASGWAAVGVTAFMLGCKYEERHNPNLGDLSYITDYSSSRQDVCAPPLPPSPAPAVRSPASGPCSKRERGKGAVSIHAELTWRTRFVSLADH